MVQRLQHSLAVKSLSLVAFCQHEKSSIREALVCYNRGALTAVAVAFASNE